MNRVKNNKRIKKTKRIIPLIILLTLVLAISIAVLAYIYTQNYITIEYIDKSASKVKTEDISSVNPIIINNVLVGGVTDKDKWVTKENMSSKLNISKGTEIDMYSQKGKMGTFETYSVSEDKKNNITYILPLKTIANQEYIAIGNKEQNIMIREMKKSESTDADKDSVKKALGKYRLLNNTIKIIEVYDVYLTEDKNTRIISATSSGKNTFGVYSAVVAVSQDKCNIVKYSYVKNTESSVNWPVYSIKFACDLNNDNKYELIIQEARERSMKYSILENRKDKYYEVLGIDFKI